MVTWAGFQDGDTSADKTKSQKEKPTHDRCICGERTDVEDDSRNYILCDVCEKWYHYECVGVNEDIVRSVTFVCPPCLKKNDGDKSKAVANITHSSNLCCSICMEPGDVVTCSSCKVGTQVDRSNS